MSDTTEAHKEAPTIDVEHGAVAAEDHLKNTTVHSLSWRDVTVTVKDRETKLPKAIVDNVEGIIHAGNFPLDPYSHIPTPLTSLKARFAP
jgi:hypothetical protein